MTAIEELSVYDIPFTGVEEAVMGWVREALELRHGTAGDPDGSLLGVLEAEDHAMALFQLRRVRARADRVDGLLAKVTQAKARAKRAQDNAQFEADQAFDEAARNNAARRASFASREERKADAALDSLEARRIAHHAARLVSVTTEAYDVVSQVHWQFEGLRKDLLAVLRAYQFEASLER